MKKIFPYLFAFFYSISFGQQDNARFVNPFIGTGGHGHTFPGACTPFGMVQLSPDTDVEGWDRVGGYHFTDTTIMGFSHTHLSGTGVGDMGDILVMATTGPLILKRGTMKNHWPSFRSRFSHNEEAARPGYYSVMLKDYNIKAEMTATAHCGFHKYTFPATDSAHIIVDVSAGIPLTKDLTAWLYLKAENDSTLSGYRLSFGWVPHQYVYFVMVFSKKFKRIQMTGNTDSPGWGVREREGKWFIASVDFKTRANEPVYVKTGISAVSIESARKNLISEIPRWDFNRTVNESYQEWNKELNKISISATLKEKEIFYTGLYHTMIAPNNIADLDGYYRGVDSQTARSATGKYYSTLSLWDTYRAAHPLYTLLHPQTDAAIVHSMIIHHRRQGFLPIWTLWGAENYCMIGNHSIPVIVDAYFKNLLPDSLVADAYRAVRETSVNPHRGSDWLVYEKYGFHPADLYDRESVSKTLEICYNDWCVAQMARTLGYTGDYTYFMNRARFYRNLYDPLTGFFRAKNSDSVWAAGFNPLNIRAVMGYTEANAWQYLWYVPHDIDDLIKLMDGKNSFAARLDTLFSMSSRVDGHVSDVTGFIGQYVHGNEPSHHIAYLYNYAGRPWKTQAMVARIRNEMYNNTPDGYAGNEDCGQMSAWYIFSSLGFYPVNPANGIYDIGTPLFKSAVLRLDNGKTFTVKAYGISSEKIYIRSATLNGKPLLNPVISHSQIVAGGELLFVMSDKPNKKWGAH